jgi:hypothetical protein
VLACCFKQIKFYLGRFWHHPGIGAAPTVWREESDPVEPVPLLLGLIAVVVGIGVDVGVEVGVGVIGVVGGRRAVADGGGNGSNASGFDSVRSGPAFARHLFIYFLF